MSFENHIRQLAQGASLKIFKADQNHAVLQFDMGSGNSQTLWILPYNDVWEFSVQSAIEFNNLTDFPQQLLTMLMAQNSKNKRAFWCIESLRGKHVLSAMLNFPSTNLTSSEFLNICLALVREVDVLEQAFMAAIRNDQRFK